MMGFLLFSGYAVVSGLVVGEEDRHNPVTSMEGKLGLAGFGLIAISGAVNYFVDLRGELLAFLIICGAALIVAGLVMTVCKTISQTN